MTVIGNLIPSQPEKNVFSGQKELPKRYSDLMHCYATFFSFQNVFRNIVF